MTLSPIENRQRLVNHRIYSLNFMASPGAGKTWLIERTISGILPHFRLAVIDGDIASTLDADRAAAAGAKSIQVDPGGECHLDAIMLKSALDQLDLDEINTDR